ncbi:MAG: hypothetical protein COB78_01555 [Hyphomicrobiales bacterium]|nr:MAG: hypothetical protein COB78_01555 [Hyphomicrobiales bacterium]
MVGLRRFFLSSFSWLILVVLLLGTVSNAVELKYPDLAMRLNPFNNNARIQVITNNLEAGDIGSLTEAEQLAIDGAYLSRGDARMFSMLGIIRERQDKNEKAQMLFDHALRLLPTEGFALLNRFGYLIKQKRPLDAVDLADIIYRRWRNDLWPLLDSYWPYILSDSQAFHKTVQMFDKSPDGKNRLMGSIFAGLEKEPENIKYAQALVAEWIAQKSENTQILVNQLVDAWLDLEKPDQAYSQFVSSMNEEQKSELGYVFNSKFNLQPTQNFFDWSIGQQQGFVARIIEVSDVGENALEIKFQDNPVRIKSIWQNLKLPSGNYELSSRYMTSHLRAPKLIRIFVGCGRGKKPLIDLPLPDSKGEMVQQKIRFEVPDDDCGAHRLWLGTEFLSMSRKNRFSGILKLFEVSIERQSAGKSN